MRNRHPKREPKSLNKGYNLDYNIDRRKANTAFNAHVFHRKEYWNLDFDRIEETVRTGKIREDKCREPNKICFERYFGKENCTYTVIVRYHKDFIEVKTAWRRKGR